MDNADEAADDLPGRERSGTGIFGLDDNMDGVGSATPRGGRPARSRSRSFIVEDDEDDIEAALAKAMEGGGEDDDDDDDDIKNIANHAAALSMRGAGGGRLGSDFVPKHPPKPRPVVAIPTGELPERLLGALSQGLHADGSPRVLTEEQREEQRLMVAEKERIAQEKLQSQGRRLEQLDEQRRQEHKNKSKAAKNKGGKKKARKISAPTVLSVSSKKAGKEKEKEREHDDGKRIEQDQGLAQKAEQEQ